MFGWRLLCTRDLGTYGQSGDFSGVKIAGFGIKEGIQHQTPIFLHVGLSYGAVNEGMKYIVILVIKQ